jgi:hypothetical protein
MKSPLCCLTLGLLLSVSGRAATTVEVAAKPAGPWKSYPTRTLEDVGGLAQAKPDANLSRYGGTLKRTAPKTGFFHATKRDGRWWLVDPEGALYLDKSVVSVSTTPTPKATAALQAKFGGEEKWAAQTCVWLRELGFNGLGAWSDTARLAHVPQPLASTRIWNFMSGYGKKRGGTFQQPGHTGYPKDAIFVFDPGFEAYCNESAKQLAAEKDDPWLFGHFTDNELPMKREALVNYLALPEAEPGFKAAQAFLRERHGAAATTKDITDADKQDFLGLVIDRYLRIVTTAVRKYDPNHMVLGPRLHGSALNYPEVLRACGRYLDVVAINYYGAWTPDPVKLAMWEREAGKPFTITEWYAKGMDAVGLANVSGAGWTVKTQRDRGLFYENFTLGLLQSKGCVGWQWFKYADNDPENLKTDPSNRDSNKGMVTNRYEPYPDLIAAMKRINERVYQIADHFNR